MTFDARTRYLLVTLAILVASAIQLVRGYRPLIVIVGAIAFLFFGNGMVFLAGSRERALRRQRRREYWNN